MHVHDTNRVLAFQRWVEGEGHDVIVVVHLATFNRFGYRIGFPGGGEWLEIFNSDAAGRHRAVVDVQQQTDEECGEDTLVTGASA